MRRKIYGQSRQERCPFCDKQGTTENKQGVPVCSAHKQQYLEMSCVCGSWLEVKKGKWGAYFHCINCGNFSFEKGLEMGKFKKKEPVEEQPKPKETSITSEDVDLFYS